MSEMVKLGSKGALVPGLGLGVESVDVGRSTQEL